jgi:hypothetical protein
MTAAPDFSMPARLGGTTDADVEGNTRLTSATGIVLLVMLAVEGCTILDVRGMITLHIVLGIFLLGPVLLKVVTTLYRFGRYYSGNEPYVRKGPPPALLRVLGPFVTISTLAVLGTGIGLLAVQPGEGLLLTAHKASFIVWFCLMSVHVVGHLREALSASWREVREASRRQRLRLSIVVLALVVGLGTALVLMPSASSWTNRAHVVHNEGH